MKVDLSNPIIKHAQTSFLKNELKEQHKENIKFKLLLLKNRGQHKKGTQLKYNSFIATI